MNNKIKCIKIETENGKTIITTETPRFLLKPKIRRFIASKQLTESFWDWLELPNKNIVNDSLSFQLDTWKREGI